VEAKGMKLRIHKSLPAEEAFLKTDREKVYAILTNLVKNAIKFSKVGTIEVGYVLKTDIEDETTDQNEALSLPKSQNGKVEFFVKDNGIGIPKDRQKAIFERFIQADIHDKMAHQGAGLGLSITKAYIEMLGGKIWVESEEGLGSTFYFTLPYNADPMKDTSVVHIATSNEADRPRKLKILIAEDDEVSEMLIDISVKLFCKEIIKARTGVEAVERCRENPDIDLVLMDIRMPEMGGYEATRQIRQFNKDVIIIAQTAYGLTGDSAKAIKAGCNDYISKPISKVELLALIRKYFINETT
jgi:CheY-like chemotaxis protein